MTNGTSGTDAAVSASSGSILDRIFSHRKAVVAAQMQIPSQRLADLQASYSLHLAPPQISFLDRLRESVYSLSLMAEIKRASPSKGIISLSCCAPAQARKYALAGASVISVLTEPEWFKGSIEDLRAVRQALEGFCNRPAILRKDFIFDEYQILEARLAGADSVLLIVKMLNDTVLTKLYQYSLSLGMEPLVEVNNEAEMKVAINLGAKVIGVNNRNLTSFDVDLGNTSRLVDLVSEQTFVCALSGISSSKDVEAYRSNRVGAVLVGEALMRAADTTLFIRDLLGRPGEAMIRESSSSLLVKVCGTRTVDAARAAMEAGADLIGIILVKGRSRSVTEEVAIEISRAVHEDRQPGLQDDSENMTEWSKSALDFFQYHAKILRFTLPRPLLVGVFQNQPLSYVLDQVRLLKLDVVQLHGSEPVEWACLIPVPVLRSFKPEDPGLGRRGYHALPLLDSAGGGSGKTLDLSKVIDVLDEDDGLHVMLAGGLRPDNVKSVIQAMGKAGSRIVGVDVSSGVEEAGMQSLDKIRAFVKAAKGIR